MIIKNKKIIALIMLILTLINTLPINVFAAFITDMNSNANFGVVAGSLNEYNHELHYATYDGTTYLVFCSQYGLTSATGKEYEYNNDFWAQYKANRPEYEKIAEMIYFGHTMKYGMGIPTTYEAMKSACATQQYVWEYVHNNIDGSIIAPSRNSWNSNYMSNSIYTNWLNETENIYKQYHNQVSFNGTSNKIDIGETAIFTDDNGVLAHYSSFDKTINGIRFWHNNGSNQLNVETNSGNATATFNSSEYGLYELMPNGTEYSSSTMGNYIYFQFTAGNVQDLIFSNYIDPSHFSFSVEVESGKITIIKQDSELGNTPQGDAEFTRAIYEVYAEDDIYNVSQTKKYYSKGNLVATRTINEDGTTEDIENLPLGRYLVKEKSASKGYMLDTNEYHVDLTNDKKSQTIISNENVEKMGVKIFKSGIKNYTGITPGLEGSEFTIKLYKDVQNAYSKGYTYAEVWNGINENGDKVTVDENRVKEAQAIAPSYACITTDSEGNAYTEKKLPYGKYICKETNTPQDFETALDFTFSISQDESQVENVAQKVKLLVVNNNQSESYVRLIKKDLKTNKNVTLNNTTFQIKATKDIFDRGTGEIIYKKGEIVTQKIGNTTYDTFTTNAQNLVVADKSYSSKFDVLGSITLPLTLPVGSYEIIELKTPEGFLQLDESVKFNIEKIRDYDTDPDGDPIIEISIKNDKPTGTLIANKKISIRENVDTSLIDISDLSGIKFKLTAKEDIIDMADGSKIYTKGQEIGIYNLSKEGSLKVDNLPMGKYELKEISTLPGLVLNNETYNIEFTQKDTTTKEYTEEIEITNDTTLTEFSKQDITGEKELEGANLKVINKKGKVIDEWISTKEQHSIEGLIVGEEYTLRETIAPDNYVKSTDVKFKVLDTNEIQHVKMIDKIVEVTKTDLTTGEEIEGAELVVTDEENNEVDNWISTKESHKVKGLEEGKTYKLTEKTCPYGYEIAETIEFTVTTDKETQKIEMKDMPILKNIRLIKQDSDTKEVIKESFAFGLYEDEECTKLIKEVQSNPEDGTIIFEDLRYGTYYIKETKQPTNYLLSDIKVKIEINDKGVFMNNQELSENDNAYGFIFYNKKAPVINTGNEMDYNLISNIMLLSVFGVIVGITVLKNRKKENKEE